MALIKADYILGIGIILMLSSHFMTQYLIAKYTKGNEVIEAGKAVIALMEANPVAALFLNFRKFSYIYSIVILPSFLMSVYYYIRKKYIDKDIFMIEAYSISIAGMFMINFFNDAANLLGFLAR